MYIGCFAQNVEISSMLSRRSLASSLPRFALYLSKCLSNGSSPTHDEDITELVEPEVVDGSRCQHEAPIGHLLVEFRCGQIELVQNPTFN